MRARRSHRCSSAVPTAVPCDVHAATRQHEQTANVCCKFSACDIGAKNHRPHVAFSSTRTRPSPRSFERFLTGSPSVHFRPPVDESGMNDQTDIESWEQSSPSRLRGPRWASRATSPTARRAEDLHFGRFTPRRPASGRDPVEPEYGGFVNSRVSDITFS